ncbi:hypothetical protein PMAC_001564 [Pneumocystis sp. 'macacae']|nr:hypothetical protein PMAC_001564 [Pneumocystis sp. 'macacae']
MTLKTLATGEWMTVYELKAGMYASEERTLETVQEPVSPEQGLGDEFHGDAYEESNASIDETKFSVRELDSSPLRSSVTQYSDAFSHKGQDLEELGAIPSTLFDSPTSKDEIVTGGEDHPTLKRAHSGRLSANSLSTKSPKIWQDSSPALQPFYTTVNRIGTRPAYTKPAIDKDVLKNTKTLTEHISQPTGFSTTQHCHESSSNDFEKNQETDKPVKLFEYPFAESLGSYTKHKPMQESMTNSLSNSYPGKWVSIPSHYLQVTNFPKTIETWMLKEIFEKFGDIQGIFAKNLRKDGSVIVGFYDVRDCIKIQKQLRHYQFFNGRYLEAQFCSKAALISMFKEDSMLPFLLENEGEILISFQGPGDISKTVLFNLLSSYGDIRTIKSLAAVKKAIICEYFDIRDAVLAMKELNGRIIQDNKLHVTFYESGFISWKVVSDELQHLQNENTVLDQFKSLDISERKLNNITNEYSLNHHGSTNTELHSKFPPLGFFSNKKNSIVSIMDRPGSVPSYYSFHDEKSPYTARALSPSDEVDYCKCNIRKPVSIQTNNNPYIYLEDQFSNTDNYVDSPVEESFDETKVKSYNPTFIPGSAPSQRRIYSVNMKRNITDDGVWIDNFPSMTEHLPLNLKYSFDALKAVNNTVPGVNLIMEKNKVDYDRITRGLDMRTTIMIKNIPNKFTQQMLQEYIDATNSKTYDFLYLRIDFRNRCNVGYAFVNFIDPISIITFGQARVGTKWNRFHSDKICDISYANIQGKECLIEKFRNSCVMDEDPSYRPKIFISHGPATGEEQEFPAPNNPRRKLRSIVSAQQFGLFPPVGSRTPWSIREEHAFI